MVKLGKLQENIKWFGCNIVLQTVYTLYKVLEKHSKSILKIFIYSLFFAAFGERIAKVN